MIFKKKLLHFLTLIIFVTLITFSIKLLYFRNHKSHKTNYSNPQKKKIEILIPSSLLRYSVITQNPTESHFITFEYKYTFKPYPRPTPFFYNFTKNEIKNLLSKFFTVDNSNAYYWNVFNSEDTSIWTNKRIENDETAKENYFINFGSRIAFVAVLFNCWLGFYGNLLVEVSSTKIFCNFNLMEINGKTKKN
jgi:hypothetical protein